MSDAKVKLAQVLGKIRTEGKVRLLNTGTGPGSSMGYARVRLSVTSDTQFSQKEVRALTDGQMESMRAELAGQFAANSLFKVDRKSVAFTKARVDKKYWAYRISYVRSGLKGPVRVEQYHIPFSNRAVLLTLSHELSKKAILAPILSRVLGSLDLKDDGLWPPDRS